MSVTHVHSGTKFISWGIDPSVIDIKFSLHHAFLENPSSGKTVKDKIVEDFITKQYGSLIGPKT